MKIKRIEIKNYRSLRHVLMENIGDLSILIGGNSSGKSNLMEALMLFFNELDPAIQRNIGSIDEYVWFDRNTVEPVEFSITIEIVRDELKEILPSEIFDMMELKDLNELTVVREISGKPNAAMWQTKHVAINDVSFIEDSKFIYKSEEMKEGTQPIPTPQPAAPPMDYSGAILQGISRKFKGKFKLISATRNTTSSPAGLTVRTAFVQPAVLGELVRLGQTLGPRPDERKWIAIDECVKETSPTIQDLRIMGGRVTIREKGSDMYFPIDATGGGYQEAIGLIYQLFKEEDFIFGIEEPELHLHPELARQFFGIVKKISQTNQTFITTHSTVFVDQVDLTDTWIMRKENKESKIIRVQKSEDLRNILFELGLRPSDLFYSNSIIFVEGPTEKVVLPILSEKMHHDFRRFQLSIIPMFGKSSGKYHLKIWTEAAGNVGIPFFVILDKGAEKEAKKLDKILKPEDNLFVLKKGSIEDYYLPNKLIEAIKSEYSLELNDEEKKKILETPRDKNIEEFLRSKDKDTTGWKINLGRKVAESMLEDEIDEEIKRIIERIATKSLK